MALPLTHTHTHTHTETEPIPLKYFLIHVDRTQSFSKLFQSKAVNWVMLYAHV